MARGRSITDFERVYINGFDMSGYSSDAGERGLEYAEPEFLTFTDAIKGVYCGKPKISFGPLNGVYDSTAVTGSIIRGAAQQGGLLYITHARGVMAVPAIGDDAFCAVMYQKKFSTTGKDIATTTIEFSQPDQNIGLNYDQPFGALLHAFGNETAVDSANTNIDGGAQTLLGGWLMYHIYSITGSGTVTLSMEDSSTGTSGWAAVTGGATGAIATASAPTSGIVQLAINQTVKRYTRWQLAFGGSATGCTFLLAFVRGA